MVENGCQAVLKILSQCFFEHRILIEILFNVGIARNKIIYSNRTHESSLETTETESSNGFKLIIIKKTIREGGSLSKNLNSEKLEGKWETHLAQTKWIKEC